jgi:tetratricopeptide (TPR) repeat protein
MEIHNKPKKYRVIKNVKISATILFGIFLAFLIIECVLRVTGFVLTKAQDGRNRNDRNSDGVSIVCLGESTTFLGGDYSYPSQLEAILMSRRPDLNVSVVNKGIIGINSDTILNSLDQVIADYEPDIIITMMGINDNREDVIQYSNLSALYKFLMFFKTARLLRLIGIHFSEKFLSDGQQSHDHLEVLQDREYSKHHFYVVNDIENPDDSRSVEDIVNAMLDEGKFDEALEFMRVERTRDVDNEWNYLHTGIIYMRISDYENANRFYSRGLEINPDNVSLMVAAGWCLRSLGRYDEASDMIDRAAKMNPQIASDLFYIGYYYDLHHGNLTAAEPYYLKTIEYDPDFVAALFHLGWIYSILQRFDESILMYRKTLEVDPWHAGAIINLTILYEILGMRAESSELVLQAVETHPENDRVVSLAGTIFMEHGELEKAQQFARQAQSIRMRQYSEMTRKNYLELKKRVLDRDIKLVCMQYPVRDIEPLKKILEYDPQVLFISNEQVFSEALEKNHFKLLFTDMFAGDFGHCTDLGNSIIAKNVADQLLEALF